MSPLPVVRSGVRLLPDSRRIITKPFVPGEFTPAAGAVAGAGVLRRIMALPEAEVTATLAATRSRYGDRHPDLDTVLEQSYRGAASDLVGAVHVSLERRLLVGAYFAHEYSFEAAALTNPSIVPAPDQSALEPGSMRFVMSLRAIGEGHRSSIVFRTGVIDGHGAIALDEPGQQSTSGERGGPDDQTISFVPASDISERVIFPSAPDERLGMEDARFVHFLDADGSRRYYATYTAFDGTHIRPRLLETHDFAAFRVQALEGEAARDKGMALFPRQVGGRYAALSRHDDESNYVAFSNDLRTWHEPRRLQEPRHPWELIKLGNCGSPIETEAGWLVITHGVGPLREYALGAMLLEIGDPSRVIGSLEEPLLVADEDERDGYVPNVVYSCGSLVHGDLLVIPYGFSDRGAGFATVPLEEVLERLT